MRTTLPLLLLTASFLSATERMPVSSFAGQWQGSCRSLMVFMKGRVPVHLEIAPDGRVTGTVGDARIVEGRIRERLWTEPRAMNHFEYRVDFRLEGPLSKADQVTRSGGRINLDHDGETLKGWFISSGQKAGGREVAQVATRELVLRRVGK